MYTYYAGGRVVVPNSASIALEPNTTSPQRGILMNGSAAAVTCDVVWDDGRAEVGVTLQPGMILPIFVRQASNASAANAVYVLRHNVRR